MAFETDPKSEDTQTSPQEVKLLKTRMASAIQEIAEKHSTLTFQDLKRLLFRCAAAIISLDKVGSSYRDHVFRLLIISLVRQRALSLLGRASLRDIQPCINICRYRSLVMGYIRETSV